MKALTSKIAIFLVAVSLIGLACLFVVKDTGESVLNFNFEIGCDIRCELEKLKVDSVYRDVLLGAREQIGVVTKYCTDYYFNGYPPEDSGACADVVSRAFKDARIDFKRIFDEHVKNNAELYPEEGLSDENINFRRVRNLRVFFENKAKSLTLDVLPGDIDNLREWQGGDIVTYAQKSGGLWHIAIVSDKRNKDGVPYIIHNYGVGVQEKGLVTDWGTAITGHYRFEEKI